jgi:predicted ArsR family transcriptional regulator
VFLVENVQGYDGTGSPPLGPRPAERPPVGEPMSRARAAVLEALQAQPGPTTLAVLADVTGLHVNTLRGHLDALEDRGLVSRRQAAPTGRGRPAALYQATDVQGRSEYAGLARALAAAIHRTSRKPRADAIAAGEDWGRELAEGQHTGTAGQRSTSDATARRRVVALLDDLGFAPEADRRNATVRLTRCPLLDAAHQYPDVVCGVHLGIARGALEAYGSTGEGTELHAFSEPGACRLELRQRRP